MPVYLCFILHLYLHCSAFTYFFLKIIGIIIVTKAILLIYFAVQICKSANLILFNNTSLTVTIKFGFLFQLIHIEEGSFIGDCSLLKTEQKRRFTVIATESCEIYKLNREDFFKIVQKYPDTYAEMEQILHKRFELLDSTNMLDTEALKNIIRQHFHI